MHKLSSAMIYDLWSMTVKFFNCTHRGLSYLEIQKVNQKDTGYYECRAMNVVAQEPAIGKVRVIVTSFNPLENKVKSTTTSSPATFNHPQGRPCPMASFCLNGATCTMESTYGEYVCQWVPQQHFFYLIVIYNHLIISLISFFLSWLKNRFEKRRRKKKIMMMILSFLFFDSKWWLTLVLKAWKVMMILLLRSFFKKLISSIFDFNLIKQFQLVIKVNEKIYLQLLNCKNLIIYVQEPYSARVTVTFALSFCEQVRWLSSKCYQKRLTSCALLLTWPS